MRRKPALLDLDLSAWPTVAHTELSKADRQVFDKRRAAIEQYVRGDSIQAIEHGTGINRRQLYRCLERCLVPHEDGRLYGFRALIGHQRMVAYTRSTKVTVQGERGSRGTVGALLQLFERHPTLGTWLRQQLERRRVVLEELGTDARLRTRLRGLARVHADFLQECRALGLSGADYPFNTHQTGIRALSSRIKAELLASFGRAARAAGASHLKGWPQSHSELAAPAATRPLQVVEFDGHRLDLRLKVLLRDPLGFEHEFEVERIWLLVILDVCTRVVLAYHLVLAREYSRYDVIKTIEKALEPHQPFKFTLPGLQTPAHGGFASQRLPELAYATWEWMRLDNAKANLANETLSALCDFLGCFADAGAPRNPDERPYVERFFGTLAGTLSSRLPGYTGSHPKDLRRALADPKGNLRLFLSLDELEELVEFSIATYNGTPHGGLNGRTPLEALEHGVRGKHAPLNWLPAFHRRTLCLMQSARRCVVRSYLQAGTHPHINLYGVRYTSAALAQSTRLIGSQLLVYLNAEDMRSVRAFLPDGAELGILTAQGAWGVVIHNLRLRQEILRLRQAKRLRGSTEHSVIEEFVQTKLAQAKNSRKAATELARTVRMLAGAPSVRTPPGPPRAPSPSPVPAPSAPAEAAAPTPPARPDQLRIGTGHAF